MRQLRPGRTSTVVATAVTVVVLAGIGAIFLLPGIIQKVEYAAETGRAEAAREQLQETPAEAVKLADTFNKVATAIRPSVVSITTVRRFQAGALGPSQDPPSPFFFRFPLPQQQFEQRGLGSGVIVSSDGYILTNYHVVRQADELKVLLSSGKRQTAKLVGADAATDLAVLKVDAQDLVPAPLGDSEKLKVGDWALAVGSPMGLDKTVTAGIISATGRANVGIADYEDFIQTDAAINPGNSGGPLVNLRGEVIGINTAIASRSGGNIGIGFAIPSNMAKKVQQAIVEEGSVTRGRLGVLVQGLTEELANQLGYDSTQGVVVSQVASGSPASDAGLKPGDIILTYNGKKVTGPAQIRNVVAGTAPGTEVELEIFRDGSRQTLTVTIGSQSSERE